MKKCPLNARQLIAGEDVEGITPRNSVENKLALREDINEKSVSNVWVIQDAVSHYPAIQRDKTPSES